MAFAGAGDPTVLLLAGSGVRTDPRCFAPADGLGREGLLAVSLNVPLPSPETWGGLSCHCCKSNAAERNPEQGLALPEQRRLQ